MDKCNTISWLSRNGFKFVFFLQQMYAVFVIITHLVPSTFKTSVTQFIWSHTVRLKPPDQNNVLCFPPEGINTPKIIKKSDQTAKALHVLLFRIIYDVIRVKWTSGLITITKLGRFPSIGEHFWEDGQIIQLFMQLTLIFLIKRAACLAKCQYVLKGTVPPKNKNTVIVYSASLFEACLLSLYYGTWKVCFLFFYFFIFFMSFSLYEHMNINYSLPCRSKPIRPSFILETQIKIFGMKSKSIMTLYI